jgi:hypothetical protein
LQQEKITPFIYFLVLIALLSGARSSFAQLELHPIKRTTPASTVEQNKHSGRTKAIKLQLPFWDDFSTFTDDIYPDENKWESRKTVWVNQSMAINAPTIGVATFDGLDSAGLAYNASEILVTGFTDSLASHPIDMSVAKLGADTSTVFLSFFYQLQGNGEPPDGQDFLQVEFKNKDLEWEVYMIVESREDFDRTVFYDTIVQVTGERFFHDAFQFRFRSYGRQSGPYDTWNIDYVYLNKGRNINDTFFPERAAASPISQLFGRYRAVPYRHFKINPELDTVYFDVKNLNNQTAVINYNAYAYYTTYTGGSSTSTSEVIVSNKGVKGASGTMSPFERVRVKVDGLPSTSSFDSNADSVDVRIKAEVISDDNTAILNTLVNDTVSSNFYLRDYYAYDDGTAEYSASLIEAGDMAAYEFDMLSITGDTTVADTLIAFDVFFPPYAISSGQTLNFTIYHEKDGKPDDDNIWATLSPRQLVSNGSDFTRMRFEPSLLINERKFFIGWRQPTAPKIFIGLDTDNDTGDKIWLNTNTIEWFQNTTIKGSLMIRPVFGSGSVDIISGVKDEEVLSVYPNPNPGVFFIDEKIKGLRIYNSTGVEVPYESQEQEKSTLIQLHQPSGMYVMRYLYRNMVRTRKVIILR